MTDKLILVTGASGYIASRLIPRLLEAGYRVRCMARQPETLRGRPWSADVEFVVGELRDAASLEKALTGVWTAYYLIHNMSSGHGYTARELEGAHNFARAAESAGVEHIIYLGGLADPRARIAAHLRSRIETGEALRSGRVPVTEFRAGVIVGPGSISFEMIRFMTELLPLVPVPAWAKNCSQPIAARSVLDYLFAALESNAGHGGIFEIGGPEVMRYSELMLEYAHLRGLKRRMIIFPYIPLWFMAFGVGLTSPVPRRIAYALIDGLRSDSRVQEPSVRNVFPQVELVPYVQAVEESLAHLHPDTVQPVWTDSGEGAELRHEGFFISHRSLYVEAPPQSVFEVVARLGQDREWLYANGLWRFRAWVDSLFQKPQKPEALPPGTLPKVHDRVDIYRVEAIEPGSRLLLHAELKAPGEGWMEWRVRPQGEGTRLSQTGFFAPRGLPGFLYWYLSWPGHELVFRGLIRAIARRAETS